MSLHGKINDNQRLPDNVYPRPARPKQNLWCVQVLNITLVNRVIAWPIFIFTVMVNEQYLSGLEGLLDTLQNENIEI